MRNRSHLWIVIAVPGIVAALAAAGANAQVFQHEDLVDLRPASQAGPSADLAKGMLSPSARAEGFQARSALFRDRSGLTHECSGLLVPSAADSPSALDNLDLLVDIEGFKGPVDLDDRNGNFGIRFAINGGMGLYDAWGLGAQAGTSAILADFHGTQFTGPQSRTQCFTTVGLFQRNVPGLEPLSWGFAYDWLCDDYYSYFTLSQWRTKIAWALSAQNELGIWAAIPDRGDYAMLQDPRNRQVFVRNNFRPITRGDLYWRHLFQSGADTSLSIGLAEEPGEVVFGADARVPLSYRLSLVASFTYFQPSASGVAGQDEEIWNVSMGLLIVPGRGGNTARPSRYNAFFPLADNGNFAVRRY